MPPPPPTQQPCLPAQVESTKVMVMEKLSPLLVRQEFVGQYYMLPWTCCADFMERIPPMPTGGLDSNGKPEDAVYGQKEIHMKVMSQNFTNCHTKICHMDAHATLNDGVVVQVIGPTTTRLCGGSCRPLSLLLTALLLTNTMFMTTSSDTKMRSLVALSQSLKRVNPRKK